MSFPVWPIVNQVATNMYRFLYEHKFSSLGINASGALLGHTVVVCVCVCACTQARSVVSDSVTHGLYPARLLCLWNFPGKISATGCHFLLQGIFQTQESNPHLLRFLHWQADSLPRAPPGKPGGGCTLILSSFNKYLSIYLDIFWLHLLWHVGCSFPTTD